MVDLQCIQWVFFMNFHWRVQKILTWWRKTIYIFELVGSAICFPFRAKPLFSCESTTSKATLKFLYKTSYSVVNFVLSTIIAQYKYPSLYIYEMRYKPHFNENYFFVIQKTTLGAGRGYCSVYVGKLKWNMRSG